MSVRRATALVALVLYALLWAVAARGATGLVEPLLLPVVLGVVIALGVALTRAVGLSPRPPRYRDPDDPEDP